MDNCLYLQIFAAFCLKSTKGMISIEAIHSQQLIKLLLYILINREREISNQELIDMMWEDKDAGNPTGALKNLVYRLRNNLACLGSGEYIIAGRGSYRWNPDIPVEADYETFERLCASAKLMPTEEERKHAYEKALSIYKGNIPENLASERWMVSVNTWYQSMYLSAAKELIQIYAREKEYGKMQQTCILALKVDELDEDFHYWLMRSLMEQYKVDLALKHYNEAVRLFRKHLGIRTSEMLNHVYEEIISMKNVNTTLDGKNILAELQESDRQEGVYFCEFAIFRELYRVESRRALRSKSSKVEYILLLTMNPRNYYKETEEARLNNMRVGMERLENVLRTCLRAGDVVSRYSDNQFVVMLSVGKEEYAVRVGRRLITRLFEQYSDKKVELCAELLTEGNNTITIT